MQEMMIQGHSVHVMHDQLPTNSVQYSDVYHVGASRQFEAEFGNVDGVVPNVRTHASLDSSPHYPANGHLVRTSVPHSEAQDSVPNPMHFCRKAACKLDTLQPVVPPSCA